MNVKWWCEIVRPLIIKVESSLLDSTFVLWYVIKFSVYPTPS